MPQNTTEKPLKRPINAQKQHRNTQQQPENAQQFAGSLFKFSISTYINFGITFLAILLTNFLIPNTAVAGKISLFINLASLIMATGILGLDQSFTRFFNKPPAKLTSNGLFRVCFYFSCAAIAIIGIVAAFFSSQIENFFDFENSGISFLIPLLFIAALAYAVIRYFYVLFRMEQRVLMFTLHSVLMTFFVSLFYFCGAFFENQFASSVLFFSAGLVVFAVVLLLTNQKLLRPRAQEFKATAMRPLLAFGIYTAPAAIIISLNRTLSLGMVSSYIGKSASGIYAFGITLSGIVTTIQAGFSTYWGAYMYANYKTEQKRIKKVHDILNFVILTFFCILVIFEDIIFLILSNYAGSKIILPLMMLGAVFNILCETTVYGIAIAKKPVFDTIGLLLALLSNFGLLFWLAPQYGLVGAAISFAVSNALMFAFRTVIAQKYYRSINKPAKTILALAVAVAVGIIGTIFTENFAMRSLCAGLATVFYCIFYRKELILCINIALGMPKGLFKKNQK